MHARHIFQKHTTSEMRSSEQQQMGEMYDFPATIKNHLNTLRWGHKTLSNKNGKALIKSNTLNKAETGIRYPQKPIISIFPETRQTCDGGGQDLGSSNKVGLDLSSFTV